VYPDILCPVFCATNTALDSGTGVAVTLGASTPGVNFALDPGGSISGIVTNEATGLPAQGVVVNVVVRTSATGTSSRGVSTNASGAYTITGLPTGTYQLFTSSSQFANEIYDNRPCAASCVQSTAAATGTPVNVTSGATTSGRDFALQPAAAVGSITGTITDAANGLPIAGVSVEIWAATGSSLSFVTTATTNASGFYSAVGLPPGTYRVDTFGNHTYRNEAFDNFPCVSQFCSFTIIQGATPVTVGTSPTTANFALNAGDGILGTVRSAAGALLQGVTVNAFQVPSGTFAGSSSTNSFGRFAIRGLPNGTYVLYTSNSLGFTDEIYNNIACPSTGSCSTATAVSSGTRITLSGGGALHGGDLAELATGIDFTLDPRNAAPGAPSNLRIVTTSGTAQFTWTAPSLFNAGAPTSYLLEAGLSPGTTFITLPITGTGTTFSVPGVPPGTYFVRIRAVNATGTGPASNEVTLSVGAGGTGIPDPPTNVFAFMSGGLLTLTWTPPVGGGPPSGYVVEAGSASGSASIASLNVTGAVFSFSPVPNGFYFLRVRSRNAAGVSVASTEVMITVGNVPAPPGAPSFTGASASSGTVTLNWAAPTQGTATSYIIEAGSATGLSNLATLNTGSTATTQSFTGVPPGTYYIRIRAVNAQGASVVSNERILTVS
jgi:5-hydroxyisourate hydrolase-like protein (transthyretin family)